jgi:hypothetical protein
MYQMSRSTGCSITLARRRHTCTPTWISRSESDSIPLLTPVESIKCKPVRSKEIGESLLKKFVDKVQGGLHATSVQMLMNMGGAMVV